jgi:hypothetical protein
MNIPKNKGGRIPDTSYDALDGHKKCRTCKKTKLVDEYVRDKSKFDGLIADCKKCKREKIQAWRAKNPGYNAKHTQKFRENNPQKRAAHLAIARALRAGAVVKEPCCVCGNTTSESHHEDYTKPLEVIWFCRTHHAEHHAAKRRQA